MADRFGDTGQKDKMGPEYNIQNIKCYRNVTFSVDIALIRDTMKSVEKEGWT